MIELHSVATQIDSERNPPSHGEHGPVRSPFAQYHRKTKTKHVNHSLTKNRFVSRASNNRQTADEKEIIFTPTVTSILSSDGKESMDRYHGLGKFFMD